MQSYSEIISSNRARHVKLFVGTALIFASMATAGQSESLYPQTVKPVQTDNVVRPCTRLEIDAHLLPSECGTLTLSAVVSKLNALQRQDNDN